VHKDGNFPNQEMNRFLRHRLIGDILIKDNYLKEERFAQKFAGANSKKKMEKRILNELSTGKIS